jgi:thiamine transporter ThiT
LFRRSTYYYNIESLSTSIHSVLVVSAKRGVWDLDVHGLFVGFLSCTGSTDLTLEIPSTCYVQHVLLWIVVSWLGLHRSSYRNTYLPNSSTSTVVGPNGCSRQSWWMIQHCASGLLYWLCSYVRTGWIQWSVQAAIRELEWTMPARERAPVGSSRPGTDFIIYPAMQ